MQPSLVLVFFLIGPRHLGFMKWRLPDHLPQDFSTTQGISLFILFLAIFLKNKFFSKTEFLRDIWLIYDWGELWTPDLAASYHPSGETIGVAPLCLAHVVLEMKPVTSCMQDKHFANGATPLVQETFSWFSYSPKQIFLPVCYSHQSGIPEGSWLWDKPPLKFRKTIRDLDGCL